MRDKTPRVAKGVPVEAEGLTGCTIDVRLNVPVHYFTDLDKSNDQSLFRFLERTIVGWDGFEMALEPDSFKELFLHEITALVDTVVGVIKDPPMASSANG